MLVGNLLWVVKTATDYLMLLQPGCICLKEILLLDNRVAVNEYKARLLCLCCQEIAYCCTADVRFFYYAAAVCQHVGNGVQVQIAFFCSIFGNQDFIWATKRFTLSVERFNEFAAIEILGWNKD